jgi:RND superfamily putative drug exporter
MTGLPDVAAVTAPVPDRDGTAALLTVVPRSGPTSTATEQLVADLRDRLADDGGARAYVTGQTAVSVDVAASLNHALPIYLALVVGLAFVLLVLVFRSLLVPLVGVLGFLLTIGAALGATVAVFQWGWLAGVLGVHSTGPLISLTPILVIGILFGLAMDYQVFLVSRMHEAHSTGRPPLDAVRTGFRQAAPVVVAAALIMFSVFASFALGSGEPTITSIAFALAVGIAADAFVVRMVLVPAALALLGGRAWWLPRWLRWLPVLDVEGAALEAAAGPVPAEAELVTS